MQADAAGDAGAQIAVLERLQSALLTRDAEAERLAGIEQVRSADVSVTRRALLAAETDASFAADIMC